MTAQVYETQRNNFLTTFIPQEPPYSFDFFLGEFTPWTAIKNSTNEFTSLGGSKESPLIYKFQETGITDFTFSIIAPNYPRVKDISPSFAWYELWIDGDKPYYFFFGLQTDILFNRTVSIFATKDKTTKFKFRLTIHFVTPTPDLKKYYFEGDPDTVYSSITAKFIPDATSKQKKDMPIIIKEDTKLQMNCRYLVYALYAKILQLDLPDEIEVGDWIEIKNMEFGKFRLNSNKADIVMQGKTTRAKNGYIQSILRGDFVRLECLEKSADRTILSDTNTVGNFTILY